MKKKSSPEKEKMQPSECDACKRCKLNVNQQNEEFISKEELHKRNGIAEGKNDYFTLYLQLFSKESLFMDTPDPSGNTDMP